MDLLESIELKARKVFESEALKVIEKEKEIYYKKYPFVKKIYLGMGAVSPVDSQDISTYEINWIEFKNIINDNQNKDEDELLDEYIETRHKSYEDYFIQFLRGIQSHDVGFCPKDIVFDFA